MKLYKAVPPSVTINKIRLLLEQLGLFIKEESYNSGNLLFTTRVCLSYGRMERLNIGANGKGINYQYALASGYAEFMERLQNYLLFKGYKNAVIENVKKLPNNYYKKTLVNKNLILDFQYDPNEKTVPLVNVVNQHFEFIKGLFPFLNDKESAISFFKNNLGFNHLKCVPFYSHKIKKEVFLPIELIHISCGSNGMSSGNTKEEALIQGFCEIFERYSGYQIYRNNITPPNIPLSEFREYPVYNLIEKLVKENDYKLIVKDCSLGLGLPTLGVLVIDQNRGKYNFNLGTALNPGIALERCLTELYQSSEGLIWYDLNWETYTDNPNYSEQFVFVNGNKLFLDGSGNWPSSLFEQKSSYDYKGINKQLDVSDVEDLNFIKDIINQLGFDIYIRDVSFMGFNSYYIVVPGMSQYPTKQQHYGVLSKSYEYLHYIRNIKNVPNNILCQICDAINADYKYLKIYNYNFNEQIVYHVNNDLIDLDFELLCFMLNYKSGKLEKALYYMNEFLKDKKFNVYRYYYAIRDVLLLELKGYCNEEIINKLLVLYDEEIYEVVNDLINPEKIMQYYKWPSCFKCEDCEIKEDCCQFEFLRIMKCLQNKHKDAKINHANFVF